MGALLTRLAVGIDPTVSKLSLFALETKTIHARLVSLEPSLLYKAPRLLFEVA